MSMERYCKLHVDGGEGHSDSMVGYVSVVLDQRRQLRNQTAHPLMHYLPLPQVPFRKPSAYERHC